MKKVLVDVGHPAHIHYFKNAAKILEAKGWEFLWSVRERECTIDLIEHLGFKYVSRGKGAKGMLKKLIYIPKIDYKLWKIARKFKPDFLLSMSSFYAAHVSKLIGKPYINFDDTEHAVFEHLLCKPFSDITISPSCYYARLSKNQRMVNSFLELFYLHPEYFTPDPAIRKELGLADDRRFVVLRLIGWSANHDVGQHGLKFEDKLRLVRTLSKYARVFISSEEELPEDLKEYKLDIAPSKLHDVLAAADLYVGEGSTTASEAAVLGTPAIYINTLRCGYMDKEQQLGLVLQLQDYEKIKDNAISILTNVNSKEKFRKIRNEMLENSVDITQFLVDFLENYPESKKKLLATKNL